MVAAFVCSPSSLDLNQAFTEFQDMVAAFEKDVATLRSTRKKQDLEPEQSSMHEEERGLRPAVVLSDLSKRLLLVYDRLSASDRFRSVFKDTISPIPW